ncbi:Cu(I)/Ag(I) efflux system membrane fusion protein [Thiogranum longum]|uniref:Cu(I)/Ag(I) efflux system membrane fusion protein n=1 Tax=Thiogranum longum TaxID=1537524 RepID=A0A4R1HD55_9GAMM|nr:efflux RND transporter periplasmic adaptor subunit [Thiogranum longum]TCK18215.1 Cu(I)/Ag(I) efflux system membrane fusion protein [Thiogranum longum]
MKKILAITALAAGFLGYLAGQFSTENHSTAGLEEVVALPAGASHYVCPMHAEIISNVPGGSCPVCGMDLVEKETGESTDKVEGMPVVTINPSVVHNLGVRTARVRLGDLQRSIETIGKITRVDPMARRTITPPIRGELVAIADKQDGDFVTEGELLFSVKSDELFEHEKAFQDAYQSGDRATANAMIPQLSKMGLTPEQISQLQNGAMPHMPVDVFAFEDGYIYTRRGRVGEKVHTGFTLFNVGGNYRVIEVTAEIFERQWGWVAQGQQARMTVRGLPGTVFTGEVVRVEPPVGYTTRSLEVALKFRSENPELSQSMFAHVSIAGQPRKHVLLVPLDSVIRTGQGDRVVRVQGKNRFQPVEVTTGEDANGLIEIRSGLKEGDQVVSSGQFLIDSESSLLAGFRRLTTPGATRPEQQPSPRHADSHRTTYTPASRL